ncbi:MAG TPA: glycosyltransferase family 4 protein [Gemmatimonadaceae bacterium]|nr:glycosyltransferase family 4 protein [Gemmatimonadaceae bacterium]
MRVLVVNWQDRENPQAGGAEIHLHEIYGRLVSWGHEVTLLCSGWPGCAPRVRLDGLDVHRVGTRHTFPLHARRYYRRVLAAWNADVLVEDINKVPLGTPRWGARHVMAHVPHLFGTIVFQEASLPLALFVWSAEQLLPLLYRHTPFEAVSESTADDLVRRGIPRHRIVVIPPGVDAEWYTPAPAERSPTPLFTYVGRLKRYKGVDLVLRAFARLNVPGAELRIAGTGDDRPRLDRLARSLDLGTRARFLGFISEEEKRALLRASWAVVFASPKEGWGLTNVEAGACGTPAIASDAPGLRESVRDGVTGMLVPHGDVDALAAAMESLARDPQRVDVLGRGAREFAEGLSWTAAARATEAHLAAVARGAADAAAVEER